MAGTATSRGGENAEHDRGTCSPKCGAPLIAAADLQTTDMLQCPVHGDICTLSELLDQTLQRQMANALKEAFKKGDDDASENHRQIPPPGPPKPSEPHGETSLKADYGK